MKDRLELLSMRGVASRYRSGARLRIERPLVHHITFGLVLSLVPILFASSSQAATTGGLRFSNTQRLGEAESEALRTYSPVLNVPGLESILPLPPANESQEARSELSYLLELQKARTPAVQLQIESQLAFCQFQFPGYSLGQNSDLDNLIATALFDVTYYTFKAKIKFDRVRPSFLSAELKTAVPNPAHPAYPSGHSSQSYVVALVLSEIFPALRSQLIDYSIEIATNRERAGVHYPSDSRAGRDLSLNYFRAFKSDMGISKQLARLQMHPELSSKPFSQSECQNFLITFKSNHDRMEKK